MSVLSEDSKAATTVAASKGIDGSHAIPLSQAVSRRYRIPNFVAKLGQTAKTFYMNERIRMITEHNDAVRRAVIVHSEEMRQQFCGAGVVLCPECATEVAWGNLLPHRLEYCPKKRVI